MGTTKFWAFSCTVYLEEQYQSRSGRGDDVPFAQIENYLIFRPLLAPRSASRRFFFSLCMGVDVLPDVRQVWTDQHFIQAGSPCNTHQHRIPIAIR
jgi:hypothetical protein